MGKIDVVRVDNKVELPHLEEMILIAATEVARIKGGFHRPIRYDVLSEHPRVLEIHGYAGTYKSRKDLLITPQIEIQEDTDAATTNFGEHIAILINLIHKAQADHRWKHGNGNDGLRCAQRAKLVKGDSYRCMLETLPSIVSCYFPEMRGPGYTRRLVKGFRASGIMSAVKDMAAGVIRNDIGRIRFGFRNLAIEWGGVRYCGRLHTLGGEELVNYAFIHHHNRKLDSPKKVFREYQSWLRQTP